MGWNWWPSNTQADIALAAIGVLCALGLLIALAQVIRQRFVRRSANRSVNPS
jgi:hypothetical protein